MYKQVKQEVLSDHEYEAEPATKKPRTGKDPTLDRILDENRQLKEKVAKFQSDVELLHRGMIEISTGAMQDMAALHEKVLSIERENQELKEQNKKLEAEQEKMKQKSADVVVRIRKLQEQVWDVEKDTTNLWKRSKSDESAIEGFERLIDHKVYRMEFEVEALKESMKNKVQAIMKVQSEVEKNLNIKKDFMDQLQYQVSVLEEKIDQSPQKVQEEIPKEDVETQTDQGVLEVLGKDSDEQEEEGDDEDEPMLSDDPRVLPTPTEAEFKYKCLFCDSSVHTSIHCTQFAAYEYRKWKLDCEKRCEKCLEKSTALHEYQCPRANVVCANCQWDVKNADPNRDYHHEIVCPLHDKSQYRDARRIQNNERRLTHGLPPRFD